MNIKKKNIKALEKSIDAVECFYKVIAEKLSLKSFEIKTSLRINTETRSAILKIIHKNKELEVLTIIQEPNNPIDIKYKGYFYYSLFKNIKKLNTIKALLFSIVDNIKLESVKKIEKTLKKLKNLEKLEIINQTKYFINKFHSSIKSKRIKILILINLMTFDNSKCYKPITKLLKNNIEIECLIFLRSVFLKRPTKNFIRILKKLKKIKILELNEIQSTQKEITKMSKKNKLYNWNSMLLAIPSLKSLMTLKLMIINLDPVCLNEIDEIPLFNLKTLVLAIGYQQIQKHFEIKKIIAKYLKLSINLEEINLYIVELIILDDIIFFDFLTELRNLKSLILQTIVIKACNLEYMLLSLLKIPFLEYLNISIKIIEIQNNINETNNQLALNNNFDYFVSGKIEEFCSKFYKNQKMKGIDGVYQINLI